MKRPEKAYCLNHAVQYYETDAMGVVHHSNYLRYFEQARVEWIRDKKLDSFHYPHCDIHWAVIESQLFHLRPAYFGDYLQTYLQVKREKLKICFQYVTFSNRFEEAVAKGLTVLVPVNSDKQITRLQKPVKDYLENLKWTETWL